MSKSLADERVILLDNEPDGCIKTGAYVYNACQSTMYYGDLFKRGDVVFMRVCETEEVYIRGSYVPAVHVHAVLTNHCEVFDVHRKNALHEHNGTIIAYKSTVRLLTYRGILWADVKRHVSDGTIMSANEIGGIQLGKEEQTN